MTLQEFVFRAPGKAQNDVFIVREGDRYGLIAMPTEGDNAPDFLTEDELRAKGGSFITLPQWDEIRANVCFNPDDDDPEDVNDPIKITCNYYVLKDGCWGVLDKTGSMIQEPQYEEVIIVNCHEDFGFTASHLRRGFDFLDAGAISGRVLVRKGSRWGMLRGHGQVVLPLDYDSIEIVCYHWASSNVYIVSKDGLYGVVDAYGKFYIPVEYPPLRDEGLDYMWDASVFRIESNSGIGYVRLGDGKCLVAPEWERIDINRLYLSGDAEPWGHIFTVWKDDHCGLILDDEGMIIPAVWDEIVPRRFVFEDPLSYSVRKGKKWGCYDASGHLICDAIWDEVDIYLNGIACVKKDGKWGAVGADGKLCVSTEWDEIEGFGVKSATDDAMTSTNTGVLLGRRRCTYTTLPGCLSWVQRDSLWGLIDREGNIIAEPIWELHDGAYARRFDAGWIELEVCVNMPEGEDILFEDEGTESEAGKEQPNHSITYYIEVRRVDENASHNDESANKPEPSDAIASDEDDLLFDTFSDDDLDEDWEWFQHQR